MLNTSGNIKLKTKDAYDLFHQGFLAMSRAEDYGFKLDLEYYIRTLEDLDKKYNRYYSKFYDSQISCIMRDRYKKKFNATSDDQLAYALFVKLKIPIYKYTDKHKPSVDTDTISHLDVPGLGHLIKMRKIYKVRGFIQNYMREANGSIVRPNFMLNIITYRSSCLDPNMQNVPKRDMYANKLIRTGFIARENCRMGESDFSGMEVSVAYCYHKDPQMYTYLTAPGADMHSDIAKQIFLISDSDFNKKIKDYKNLRQEAKSSFTFAQFYGDYYANCARYISNNMGLPLTGTWTKDDGLPFMGTTIGEHFINEGIHNHEEFEKHVRDIEKDLWYNRFPVYREWKESLLKQYHKDGFIDTLTGFRVQGRMDKNAVINYPVQGSAFHILLWTFIHTDKFITANKMESRLLGQIHDALVSNYADGEEETVIKQIHKLGTQDVRQVWDWISIPLDIEHDISELNGNWANLKEYNIN